MRRAAAIAIAAAVTALAAPAAADDAPAAIDGIVLDADTFEGVAGATVAVDVAGVAVVTGAEGEFELVGLPAGEVEVRVSIAGRPDGRIRHRIPPGERRSVVYQVAADGTIDAGEAIVVEEFDEPPPPPPPAAVSEAVDVREAARVAGAGGDAGKVVQNLAGVARPAAGSGALVVWGASPRDTAILVDGVELPALYHLGGIRSVLATDLVQTIELTPGAFGADVGRALGGVVRVTTAPLPARPTARIAVDALDGTVALAGPLGDRVRAGGAVRGSWVDRLVEGALDDQAAELFSLPRYGDAHARVRTVLGEGEHVDVVALGAGDRLARTLGGDEPATPRRREQTIGFARLWVRWQKHAGGVTAAVTPWAGIDVDRTVEAQGATRVERGARTWRGGLRADYRTRAGRRVRLGLGADVALARAALDRRGTLTVPAREGDPYVFGRPPGADVAIDDWTVVTTELAPYASVEVDLGPVTLAPGVRIGALALDVSRALPEVPGVTPRLGTSRFDWLIEPRLAATWRATPRVRVSAAAGRHSRAPAAEDLSAIFGNPTLGPERGTSATVAAAVDAGVAEVEVAGFARDLDDLVVRSREPAPLVARLLVQDGEGAARGVQVTVRRPPEDGVSGWIAYTYSQSERVDAPGAPARRFDFDQPHVLTAVGTVELGRWTVGARVRVASGAPRTPVIGAYYEARLDRWEPVFGALNADRLPVFVQVDARVERALTLGGAQVMGYVEVLNATARDNAEEVVYTHDYARRGYLLGLPVLAVAGVEARL